MVSKHHEETGITDSAGPLCLPCPMFQPTSPVLNLCQSLSRAIWYVVRGRLRFPKDRLGREFAVDGQPWIIFREAVVDPQPGSPAEPEATFIARFHVARLSTRQNIWFSCLPMLLILGLPGFRSKLWMYNRYGDVMGFYRWQTAADAERFANSAAVRFMTRRSLPGHSTSSRGQTAG